MTQHWVNPVNATSDAWGYKLPPRELMRTIKPNASHTWHAPTKKLQVDDLIWIRESLPLGAFIGVGTVATEPVQDHRTWYYEIKFDVARCHAMATSPHHVQMDKRVIGTRPLTKSELARLRRSLGEDLKSIEPDIGKQRRTHEVVARQGQQAFREALISVYGGCAVTGYVERAALQAAHIRPYDGGTNNQVTNGLLLRADIHNLFDIGFLWVTDTYKVQIDPTLRNGEYGTLHGKKLRLPVAKSDCPSAEALAAHRQRIALRAT